MDLLARGSSGPPLCSRTQARAQGSPLWPWRYLCHEEPQSGLHSPSTPETQTKQRNTH